MSLRPVIGILS